MKIKQGFEERKINKSLETRQTSKNCLSPVTTPLENTVTSKSSPRRKRSELSFLQSDLSPKYIGFLSSPKENDVKRTSRFNISESSKGSISPIYNISTTPIIAESLVPLSNNHQKFSKERTPNKLPLKRSDKSKKRKRMAIKTEKKADTTSQSQDINDNRIENNLEYCASLSIAEKDSNEDITESNEFEKLDAKVEDDKIIKTDETEILDFIEINHNSRMKDISFNNIQSFEKDNTIEKEISHISINSFDSNIPNNLIDGLTSFENYDKNNFYVDDDDTHSPQNTNSLSEDFDGSTSTGFTVVGKSMSTESDSANGSSVDTETNIDIVVGGLFWGQMAQYPYWPCIVCPDPEGRTISVKGTKQHKQYAMIHVRFFADNGRRGWVKKTNLIAYEGCESFIQKAEEIKKKVRAMKTRLNMLKLYVINNPKNKSLWQQAVNEADLIFPIPIENRIEKFEEVVNNMKELNQSVKRNSNDVLSKSNKRQRSPTPESPTFEPIFSFKNSLSKKPKTIFSDVINDEIISQYFNADLSKNWINNEEFNEFEKLLKWYVYGGEKNYNNIIEEKLNTVIQQVWVLKEILKKSDSDPTRGYMDNSKNFKTNKIRRMSQRLGEIARSPAIKPTPREFNLPIVPKEKKLQKKPPSVDEVIDAIFQLDKNYLFKGLVKGAVCIVCQNPGDLLKCNGNCFGMLHSKCGEVKSAAIETESNFTGENLESSKNLIAPTSNVVCPNCASNEEPKCFVCKMNDGQRLRCYSKDCGKHFHLTCLNYWPQTKFLKSGTKDDCLFCPAHICHTCVSDDPKKNFVEIEKSKLIRCIDCPATYHMDSTCIPAGSEFITASQIICPKHFRNPKIAHVNVNWCFFCVKGGKLVCCETCPTAFHKECLHLDCLPEVFICEECETGRMPLYGEIVWAKFNNFRWWPSIIIPPPLVPNNLIAKQRHPSEFLIRFFGTNDHGWINRQRVYLYQDGDFKEENYKRTKSNLDSNYVRGVEEACRVAELIKQKLPQKPSKSKILKICPRPYLKIKVNRSVPPVRINECDLSKVNVCECDANMLNPCGPESGCLNRMLLMECNPKVCPAGSKCLNQLFEKRSYQQLDIVYMKEKGFGLVCLQPISAGTFIIEYVGEIINDQELRKRIALKQLEKDENYYYLTVEKDYIIDAGLKGNMARFMNHSCEPNCETQKWTVNGVNRVGLFALEDLPANTELTFNYYLECIGSDKKPCFCGAKKCAGYIGSKFIEPVKEKLKEVDELHMANSKSKRSVGRQLKAKTMSKVTKQPKNNISSKKKDIFVKLVKDGINLISG